MWSRPESLAAFPLRDETLVLPFLPSSLQPFTLVSSSYVLASALPFPPSVCDRSGRRVPRGAPGEETPFPSTRGQGKHTASWSS